jgi:D-serine deaminase-like pyridoxal phosphate-dependent protein
VTDVRFGSPDRDWSTLDTPALLVDEVTLVENIEAMASRARELGLALRPHVKTHKCVEIARLQIAHGAEGLTVATIGEAEVFASAGFTDLFIAYPVRAQGAKAQRLKDLAAAVALRVGVDSSSSAELLADCLRGTSASLLIEVDSGGSRSGVRTPKEALAVAHGAGDLPVIGVFTHGGHSYREPGQGPAVGAEEGIAVRRVAAALRRGGYPMSVLSTGSTPTAGHAAAGVTEIRPGTYVFNDRLQVGLGSCEIDRVALVVAATVVSRGVDHVVLDAGAKTLSKDLPGVLDGYGAIVGRDRLRIERLYDHHAVVTGPVAELPGLGEVLAVVPNHVCPVVDLDTELVLVPADPEAGIVRWTVDAHSRSR